MSENSKAIRTLLWLGIPFLVIITLAVWLVAANRPPMVILPPVKLPNPNGWDDLAKAGEIIGSVRPFGPYSSATHPPEKWTAAELASWVKAEAPAFDLLRQGLKKKCMHPPMRHLSGFDTLARLRELARCTAGEALYYEVIGKPGKAADSLLDGTEMGIVTQRGGPLISGLVGIAIEMITIRHLEPLMPKLSRDDLTRVAARMEKIKSERVAYSDMLIEEGRCNAVTWAEGFRSENRFLRTADWNGQFTGCGIGSSPTVARVKHSVSFAFANKSAMIAESSTYLEALVKEQRAPYTGKSRVPVPNNPLIGAYGDTFVHARVAFVRNEAIFAVLQTEVALLRYQSDHGRYPNSLAELAPDYVQSLPVDPFGLGRPLRYEQTKGGKAFLLYSLGPDLRDDHGKPIQEDYVTYSSVGDIVAGRITPRKP